MWTVQTSWSHLKHVTRPGKGPAVVTLGTGCTRRRTLAMTVCFEKQQVSWPRSHAQHAAPPLQREWAGEGRGGETNQFLHSSIPALPFCGHPTQDWCEEVFLQNYPTSHSGSNGSSGFVPLKHYHGCCLLLHTRLCFCSVRSCLPASHTQWLIPSKIIFVFKQSVKL